MSRILWAVIILMAGAPQTGRVPALRELLAGSDPSAVTLLADDCLNTKVAAKGDATYISVPCHINPSAEHLFVFSRDLKLKGEIYGWALLTLPDDYLIYYDSEVHFAPTHSLGISVFDPATGYDRKIYPPVPYQPVRQEFIGRVAEVYKGRGEEWFNQHNHHGNPELFDSRLEGDVTMDAAHKTINFMVRYGDPDNANDPLPFTESVKVSCSPLDSVERMRCFESRASGSAINR